MLIPGGKSGTEKLSTVLIRWPPLQFSAKARPEGKKPRTPRRQSPGITPEIRIILHKCRHLHRKVTKDPANQALRTALRTLRQQSTTQVRRAKNSYFRSQCTSFKNKPRQLWNTINQPTGRLGDHTRPGAPIPSPTATLTFLSFVCDPTRQPLDTPPSSTAEPWSIFQPVTADQVMSLLDEVQKKKAAGPDGIPQRCILCTFAAELAPSLTTIFNTSLQTSTIPDDFNFAAMHPISKEGDSTLATNYRPISLLPVRVQVVSKLLEKIVQEQLTSHLDNNHVLPPEQFACRPNSSTEDALTPVIARWKAVQDKRTRTGVVFLDMSKALTECFTKSY